MSKSKSKEPVEKMIQRTTILKTGEITQHEVPLSSLKRDAIDLSADSPNMTFLLTRDAAVRITEHAITRALDKAWKEMVKADKEKKGVSKDPAKIKKRPSKVNTSAKGQGNDSLSKRIRTNEENEVKAKSENVPVSKFL